MRRTFLTELVSGGIFQCYVPKILKKVVHVVVVRKDVPNEIACVRVEQTGTRSLLNSYTPIFQNFKLDDTGKQDG